MEQFRSAFEGESLDEFQMMSVYNSGNWFVDKEVPPKARQGIYSTIASSKCEALIVESLPQFITQKSIKEAKTFLGNKQLIVAIGLQSANDFVRNVCVNTTCTKQQFERAVTLLWKNDYIPRAYLMIKPPFLTELEAIEDAVSSIHYVASLGFEDVSICPTRIAPHTIAAELMKRGLYEPPSLWSVIEILRRVQEKGISTRVSCLDLDGKDDDTFYPRSCKQCTPQLIEALKKFNRTADLTPVEQIKCDCKYEYQSRVANEVDDTPLPDRIRNFINLFNAQASDTIPIERTT
jgi:radical SAM enzyme (TIGR01210 family)